MIIHVGRKAARAAVPSIWAVADVTPKKTTSSQPSDFIFVICEVNGATCWPEKYDTVVANFMPAALKPFSAFSPNSPSW